jgi:HK97 family phage major capsid protein
MKLHDLKAQHKAALDKAESFVKAAESASRLMTTQENTDFDSAMVEVNAIASQIDRVEKLNTLKHKNVAELISNPANGAVKNANRKTLSTEYVADFWKFMTSFGREIGAALYEGSNAAGGYAVPVTVDGQIIPLAPNELAIRQLARVITTQNDIKFPQKNAHGTAAAKAEGDGTGTNVFGGASPSLTQVTLSSFMAGDVVPASIELLQDVGAAEGFINDDIILAVQQYEDQNSLLAPAAESRKALLLAHSSRLPVRVQPA